MTTIPVPPRERLRSMAIGAVGSWLLWGLFVLERDVLPVWLRLAIAVAFIVYGFGAGLTCVPLEGRPRLVRIVVACGVGFALGPLAVHVLSTVGAIAAFPWIAAALGGISVGYQRAAASTTASTRIERRAAWILLAVSLAAGTTAFAHRLHNGPGPIAVRGADDYDSYDLSYYAAIGSELSHTMPPTSPFYAGRALDHAFYPHVELAMLHRFGHVPLLDLYFRYAWPLLVVLAVLTCFVFVKDIAGVGVAFWSALFFGVGSNFAYLAKWFLNVPAWDDVVWGHNLQGAAAETLFYGDWAPAFVALFVGLFALQAAMRSPRLSWAVIAGAAFATTVFSKPWMFASIAPALAVVWLTSLRDRTTRGRLLLVGIATIIIAAPLLFRVVTTFDDAQVVFERAFFPIPLVAMGRIGWRDWFATVAQGLTSTDDAKVRVAALMAEPVFLFGTLGFRLVGLPSFWSSLWRPGRHDVAWRVLAWTVLTAVALSSFVVSVPYHETVQIHQLALFLMAPFAARGVMAIAAGWRRNAVAAIVLALAVPCTVQYLARRWHDRERPAMAQVDADEQAVATYLLTTDPERTVVLHDRPNDPSMIGILGERRSVLAWAGYVRGSDERRGDVETFFGAPDANAALHTLHAYHVTHVVEYLDRDHVNPDVQRQLQLALRQGNVAIYQVPEGLRK